MDTLTFLNSPLLWGLSLAAIPLIIHLLYRRQYRRVDWAPMRYLKLSIQRNRRRIRIEQLLLLLLRTAVVLLLFFLVARPVMHADGLSRWVGASARTNRIVVLDDSLSMGYTEEGVTALARGQDIVADLLPTFGAKDAFTLVAASRPNEPLLREVELANIDDVAAAVRGVKPTEMLAAWPAILRAVDELMASGSYPIYEVTLVTDLRRAGWDERVDELANRWAASGARLRVFDLGVDETANVALLGLQQADRVPLVAVPTRFEAEIRNDAGRPITGLEANFIVDGKASLVRLPELAADQTLKLPLSATFQEPGEHNVALELAQDALAGDNRRTAVVDVRESIAVQLVDGEPSTEPLGGEADFLALALSLSGDAADAFRVEVLTDSEWVSTPQANPDVLVLAGVAQFKPEQVELLERQVAAGVGLIVFVADGIDPDLYNQLLYKDGAGLLGASLVSVAEGEFSGLLVEAGQGSPLEALAQLAPAALQRIKVRKTYEVKLPEGKVEGVRVLARWNNQAAAPAVIEKVYGEGRVLVCTTAADRSWSDWPTEASYVLAVREAVRAIARSGARLRAFTAGQKLSVAVPASRSISLAAVEVPQSEEPQPLLVGAGGSNASAKREQTELSYADTRRAGLYKMTWRDSASGPTGRQFAVNPERRESDLARISVKDFQAMWGALEPEVISIGARADASLAVRGREIWRSLATCLFGLLVFEACFARWAGRQR
jgi:hypothetical protein